MLLNNKDILAEKLAEKAERKRGVPLGKALCGAARSRSLDAPLTLAPKRSGRRPLTAQDAVYLAGKKRILKRPDEVVIARRGVWLLTEVTGWTKNDWVSLKLMRLEKSPKAVWYLGFKDDKLARNRDKEVLEKKHLIVCDWVIKEMKRYLNKGI